MPNRPLRVCPTCGGTGHPSYIRSGAWLNEQCPKANGPVDADDFPDGHELDCADTGRFHRVEYKRPGESWQQGQQRHILELHAAFRSCANRVLLLLEVLDEQQAQRGAQVEFRFLTSREEWRPVLEWATHRTTLEALARSVSAWIWENGPEPPFFNPPPPACQACGAPLARRPQQTLPVNGRPVYVCAECFRAHFGVAARRLEVTKR
jgi:hypothetical protein